MNSATGGNVIFNFTGDDSKLKSTMGNLVKSFTLGNLATKAISKGMQTLTENIGSAVKRIDVMNNFPKVMENFGVSVDEANKSVKRIDKSVRGLPTPLNQAVQGVQNIFMVTKNLKQAEDMFSAINNSAMVFAQGSTEAVDRFIYAYKQSLATGKVYAQDFNQMNSAIPGIMDKIAQKMGITMVELKNGLSDGTISIEEFNNAFKDLNTKGGAGMKALQEVAKSSTGGIETSFTNMRTAIVRGITNMIEKVNEALKPYGGLSSVISNLGKVGEQVFTKLGDVLGKVIPKLIDIFKWINKNKNILVLMVAPILAIVGAFKGLLFVAGMIKSITSAINGLKTAITIIQGIPALLGILKTAIIGLNATLWASPITWIIAGIVAFIVVLVLLYNKCEWFRDGVHSIINAVVGFFKGFIDFVLHIPEHIGNIVNGIISFIQHIPEYVGWLIGFLVGSFVKFVFVDIPNFVNGIINFVKKLPSNLWNIFLQVIAKVVTWLNNMNSKAINGIRNVANAIINGLANLPSNMLKIGKNIVLGIYNGIANSMSWLVSKVKSFASGIIKGFTSALGIHSPSTLMADKVGQWIPKGIAVGITANSDSLNSAINGIQKDLMTALNPNIATGMNLSPNIVINNNIDVQSDPLGQTVRNIKTFANGSKNDYNYGAGL